MRESFSDDVRYERRQLRDRIRRYERKVRSGEATAVLHEQLLRDIAFHMGDATAEYFDRKQTLPYKKVKWLPMPVEEEELETASMLRLAVSFMAGFALAFSAQDLVWGVVVLIGILGFFVVYLLVIPLLVHMPVFGVGNLAQREADVREFEEIKVAHEEAQVAESIAQEADAKEKRAARLTNSVENARDERQ